MRPKLITTATARDGIAYYNDNDAYCCSWLRNLIDAAELPNGTVDQRSIADVTSQDLRGYSQCHFFAGIGGWGLALRLAGWPADAHVWTASLPCQPLSCAGKQLGDADERHLWPVFYQLVRECSPAIIFGEQVASKDGLEWLDGVFADLEDAGYACGAADLCAAGQGAPHIRQRLYWVANTTSRTELRDRIRSEQGNGKGTRRRNTRSDGCGSLDGMVNCALVGRRAEPRRGSDSDSEAERRVVAIGGHGATDGMADTDGGQSREVRRDWEENLQRGGEQRQQQEDAGVSFAVADTSGAGLPGLPLESARNERTATERSGWTDYRLVNCRDGKSRRISAQPGDEPLAARLPRSLGPGGTREQRVELVAAKANRVGRLRGYGNAIVPQVAAEFIRTFMEVYHAT
jgi:DNA (cytosine-5)-methyltransferase 1